MLSSGRIDFGYLLFKDKNVLNCLRYVLLLLFYLHQTLQGTIPSKTLAKIFLPKPKFSRKIKHQTRAFPKTDENVSEMTARLTGENGNELWIV